MKKSILFVMNNLHCGGAEKALISLLETIDYSKFDVDLLLFKQEGIFLSKLPEEVNLLEEPAEYGYFDMPIKKALANCFKKGDVRLAMARIKAGYVFKKEKNRAVCEQKVWKYLSTCLEKNEKQYDAAIGYLEKTPVYYCIEKVKARKKIGFVHNDYIKLGMDSEIDKAYFKNLDSIVTVSEECAQVLKDVFPMYQDKIEVMMNILSTKVIEKLAAEAQEIERNDITLVSIGRLNEQKGFDMAVKACKKLLDSGHKVKWHILGEGLERSRLEMLIKENGLEQQFILAGLKANPYPYVKQADIYVQPSRFEGKSIAIDEAKILQKPIVATNFSTVGDQLVHLKTGFITEMSAEALAEGIQTLIRDKSIRERLTANLAKEELNTEMEIHKLYKMVTAV